MNNIDDMDIYVFTTKQIIKNNAKILSVYHNLDGVK
jgi:hypothetical protein